MTNGFKINQNEIVKEARMSLIKTEPFYASILLNLELVETPTISTFAVNSTTLKYNPVFASKLSFATMKVVLQHEVLHLVLHHHLRGSRIANYNHSDFNIAADLALNCEIFHIDGFPDDALLPGRDSYIDFPFGKSAEFYYDLIQQKKQEEKEKESKQQDDTEDQNQDDSDTEETETSDSDTGDSEETDTDDSEETDTGDSEETDSEETDTDESEETDTGDSEETETQITTFGDFEECDEDDIEEETQRIQQITIQAAAACENAGADVPNVVEKTITDLMGAPQIPWKIVLRNFLSSHKKCGINWMVPSRRVRSDKFMMPSRQVKTPGDILFVLDVSGSFYNRENLDVALAEIQSVMPLIEKFDVIQFDTKIRAKDSIGKNDNIADLKLVGGGGTRFSCVVDELKTMRNKPKLMVVLTDLYFEGEYKDGKYATKSFKKDLQGLNVLWLCTSDEIADCGKTVKLLNK